jgi:hypothetical protein
MNAIIQFIQDNWAPISVLVFVILFLLTIFTITNVNFKPAKKEIVYEKEMIFPLTN